MKNWVAEGIASDVNDFNGGDPMKRSLKNQLFSQFGYGMMISNTICNPLLTWRIMFGPMPEGYIFIR